MERDEAERTEAFSIDQMWAGVGTLSRLPFPFFCFIQIEDLVVKSILCGLTSLKEEMNTGQKKEVYLHPTPFCSVAGEVNVQHVQAAWIRHPPRLPPQTSSDRGECTAGVPQQPVGRLCQQTHGWSLTSDERLKTFPDQRDVQDCGLPHPP